MTNIHGFKCTIPIHVYILWIHIMYKLFSGPNCFNQKVFFLFFFFFCALWRICLKGIFFMNKGFDAYSFPCEMGSIAPWGKLHSENQSSCDPLCVCFFFLISITKVEFCEYVCNLLVCLMKFGWCHPLHRWSEILLIT